VGPSQVTTLTATNNWSGAPATNRRRTEREAEHLHRPAEEEQQAEDHPEQGQRRSVKTCESAVQMPCHTSTTLFGPQSV